MDKVVGLVSGESLISGAQLFRPSIFVNGGSFINGVQPFYFFPSWKIWGYDYISFPAYMWWELDQLLIQIWILSRGISQLIISRPGTARDCSTNTFVINSVIQWWFVKISSRRRHTPMVKDCAFSHKIDYVTIIFLRILNLEGNQNCSTGVRVMAILLNGWVLPVGGVSLGRVGVCSLWSRLV